jgi:hypothetical protein
MATAWWCVRSAKAHQAPTQRRKLGVEVARPRAQAIAAVNLTRSSLRAVTWVAGLGNRPQSPLSQLRNQKLFHDLFCVVLNSTERELLLVLDSHIVVWFFSTVSLQGSGEILLLLLSLEPTM